MSERSIEVFKTSQAAWDKFDYFICSVAGALFAYIAQTYSPLRLSLGYPLFEPLALLFLSASFLVGLLRIECCGHLGTLNSKQLHASECAGEIMKVLASPPASGVTFNVAAGYAHKIEDLPALRIQFLNDVESLTSKIGIQQKRSLLLCKARNRLLILGFLMILSAKILQPYNLPQPLIGEASRSVEKTNTAAGSLESAK